MAEIREVVNWKKIMLSSKFIFKVYLHRKCAIAPVSHVARWFQSDTAGLTVMCPFA